MKKKRILALDIPTRVNASLNFMLSFFSFACSLKNFDTESTRLAFAFICRGGNVSEFVRTFFENVGKAFESELELMNFNENLLSGCLMSFF